MHEANARAGLANKVGARFAGAVAAAVPGSGLPHAEVLGIPLRRRSPRWTGGAAPGRREFFGLPARTAPALLVFGGSQGAQRDQRRGRCGAARTWRRPGSACCTRYGRSNAVDAADAGTGPPYVAVPYMDRMDLAYAAADLVLAGRGR